MTFCTFSTVELIPNGTIRPDLGVESLAAVVCLVVVSRRTNGIFNCASNDSAVSNASTAVVVEVSHDFWFLGTCGQHHGITMDIQGLAMEKEQQDIEPRDKNFSWKE
jgi:hypothetical protein